MAGARIPEFEGLGFVRPEYEGFISLKHLPGNVYARSRLAPSLPIGLLQVAQGLGTRQIFHRKARRMRRDENSLGCWSEDFQMRLHMLLVDQVTPAVGRPDCPLTSTMACSFA
jgi:hypothetical protein